jgi:hypothetical protein
MTQTLEPTEEGAPKVIKT